MSRLPLLLIYLLTTCCIATEYEAGILIREGFDVNHKLCFASFDFFVDEYSITDGNLLVDKSLLIKDVIEADGKVYLITCPRGWSKTQNLYMLRKFFEYTNHSGSMEERYSLFVEGKNFESPFLIAKYNQIIDEHMGKHPVIYIRLIVYGDSFEEWLKVFQCTINEAYGYHFADIERILNDTIRNEEDSQIKQNARRRLRKFMSYRVEDHEILLGPELHPEDVIESMNFLSETLYKCYNRNVIILMDEYFEPWFKAFRNTELKKLDREKCRDFYMNFMKATFRDNLYLKKAVLIGILQPPEELSHSFPNVTECNLLTGKFMEHFGFNQWDLKKLYEELNICNTTQHEIDRWYKGYRVNNRDLVIYSAVSITEFLTENKTDDYWVQTGKLNHLLKNFLQVSSFRHKWNSLKVGKSIIVKMETKHLTWADYEYLIEAMYQPMTVRDEFTDRAFMLLFTLGYLTLSENVNTTTSEYPMKFPNKEILSAMQNSKTISK